MCIIDMYTHSDLFKGETVMKQNNGNLNELLEKSSTAKSFFGALPDYVQGGIMLRSSEIKNEDDLHKCADVIKKEFE